MATQIGSNLATPITVGQSPFEIKKAADLAKKKVKQTDKLIKAVEALEKRLTSDSKKSDSPKFSWKGGIKGAINQVNGNLKEKFSLKGLAGMAGINPGGMLGSMIDARDESIKSEKVEKAEKLASQTKHVKLFAESAGGLKAAANGQDVTTAGLANYHRNEKRKLDKVAEEKQQDRYKEMEDAGLKLPPGAVVKYKSKPKQKESGPTVELDDSESVKSPSVRRLRKSNPIEPKEDTTRHFSLARKLEARGGIAERAIEAIQSESGPMSSSAKGGMKDGIIEGIQEELLKLNEEQLKELEKLVDNTTTTEEDRLEKKAAAPSVLGTVDGKGRDKDKPKSVMDSMLEMVKGPLATMLTGPLTAMLSKIPGVGKLFAGPGAAAAAEGAAAGAEGLAKGAGSAAEGAAKSVSKLGKFAKILPGLGTALAVADGAHTAYSGWSDANADLESGKITKEEAVTKKSEAVGEGVGTTGGALAGAAAGAAMGSVVPVVGTIIGGILGGLIGAYAGGQGGKALGNVAAGKINALSPEGQAQLETKAAAISAPSSAVEASANKLEQTTKTNEDLKTQKEAADRAPGPSATIVNNNTSNNSTTTTRVSPPVRPLDTTINARMNSSYGVA